MLSQLRSTAAVLLGIAALFGAAAAHAATFTVTTTAVAYDALPGDGICADIDGACSLAGAVAEANAYPGADTISIPAGTYDGQLVLTEAVTLAGAGAAATIIDGHDAGRVIDVAADGVTLAGVTVQHGRNNAIAFSQSGTLTIGGCVIRDNVALNTGGGIENDSGTLLISGSTITGNTAGNTGAGIWNGGTTIIVNSTISGNQAGNTGGGIRNYPGGSVTIRSSTITGNRAGNVGGGIEGEGSYHIENSIIALNAQGGGFYPAAIDGWAADCEADITLSGANLIRTIATGCRVTNSVPSNPLISGVDPLLGALQDNGGDTPTHALLAGSPAIDAGTVCEPLDQRGMPRPQGAACDIGAYEDTTCNRDGTVDPGEACDDGNATNGDGCSWLCQNEFLDGDGLLLTGGTSPSARAVGGTANSRLSFRSKDAGIRVGRGNFTGDDPVLHGASLRVSSAAAGFDTVYELPAANWRYSGRPGLNRGYIYKDQLGAGPIGIAAVKTGKLVKVVGKGGQLAHSLAVNPNPVAVVLTLGEQSYVLQYGGDVTFSADRLYKARHAVAPAP